MKRIEKIIILLILLFSVIFIVLNKINITDKVIVSVKDANNNTLMSFDINEDNYYSFDVKYGKFNLEVKGGKCRAIDVDCPNQICVHTGYISSENPVPIICLPNGIMVTINE